MGSTSKLLAGVAAAALLCGSVVLGDNPVAGDDIGYDLPNVIANLEVHSARHSRVEDFAESLAALSTDGYTLLIEDNAVAVYFNEENASIRVMDKKSGYVWGCLEPGAEANKTWSSVGNGILAVDLVDSKLVAKKQGLGYPGETSFDYKVSGKTAAFTARFTKYGVTIPFTMSLVDGNLKFEMDTTKIEETGKYLVQNVYFVPFLGSTKEDEVPGYFFLPDGSGALMRFQKSSSYTVVYNERIYGKDYAIDQTAQTNDLKSSRPNDFLTDANNVTLPVFGGVQGVKQHGFVAEVTGGAEFAAIMATPAGMTTKYNWITSRFIVRQNYMQPTSKSGSGVQVTQRVPNAYTASIEYHFLDGDDADYIGMAKWYRSRLQERGILTKKADDAAAGIPMQLDLIMADVKKGFLFNSTTSITTTDQVAGLMDALKEQGIANTQYVLKGWQSGGLGGYNPQKLGFEKKSGKAGDYRTLSEKAAELGNTVVFYDDPMNLTERQLVYAGNNAHTMSQMPVQIVLENYTLLYNKRLFVGLDILANTLENSLKFYQKQEISKLAFGSLGGVLYADQYRGQEVYRDQALAQMRDSIAVYAENNMEMAFYTPNLYMLPYCSAYYDMPLTNSQFQFETDSVPFLPIVFKGSLDYFTPYVNEGLFSQTDVLKMVEYGAYPAYVLTGKQNFDISDTASNQLFSTYIEEWQGNIVDTYGKIDKALRQVAGSTIEDREVLREGVVRVTYANGVEIYVNYLGTDYTDGDIKVPAQDYLVRG